MPFNSLPISEREKICIFLLLLDSSIVSTVTTTIGTNLCLFVWFPKHKKKTKRNLVGGGVILTSNISLEWYLNWREQQKQQQRQQTTTQQKKRRIFQFAKLCTFFSLNNQQKTWFWNVYNVKWQIKTDMQKQVKRQIYKKKYINNCDVYEM